MKNTRKFLAVLMVFAMIMSMGVLSAFAATITIKPAENVSVNGKEFKAYRILNAEVVGKDVHYSVPEALVEFYADYFELTSTDDFDYRVAEKIEEMEANSDDLFEFAAAALEAAKDVITPVTATGNATSAEIEVGEDLGYYVIEDTATSKPVSALMLQSATANVELTLKADKPSADKNIDAVKDTDPSNDEDEDGLVKFNNTSFGDVVPYVIDSAVPDMTGYTQYYFIFNDTMSKGLQFNNDVKITIGGDENELEQCDGTCADNAHTCDYYVESNKNDKDETSITIVLVDFIDYAEQTGDAIQVTYTATVTTDAKVGIEGNPNLVTLTYSNNPNEQGTGKDEPGDDDDDVVGKTPESITRTYVTDASLIKIDPDGNRLTGAKFKIEGARLNTVVVKGNKYVEKTEDDTDETSYWLLKDGSYTDTDPTTLDETTDAEALAKYEDTETVYKNVYFNTTIVKTETVVYEAAVDADGYLEFEGLGEGVYTITETEAPNGYNLLKGAITLTIDWTEPEEGSTNCKWTYKWSAANNDDAHKIEATADNSNQITVKNQKGIELPSTGAMGTVIFVAVGSLIAVAAVCFLVTKKRMKNLGMN